MAQSYADQCNGLTHNSQQGRWTRRFGSCGENIFIATHKVSWQFAMKSWFSEKDLFTYGCNRNNLTEVKITIYRHTKIIILLGWSLHSVGLEL